MKTCSDSKPDCELYRRDSFEELHTNNHHDDWFGTKEQATQVHTSEFGPAVHVQNVAKCSTCHLMYKQLQTVFERQASNDI